VKMRGSRKESVVFGVSLTPTSKPSLILDIICSHSSYILYLYSSSSSFDAMRGVTTCLGSRTDCSAGSCTVSGVSADAASVVVDACIGEVAAGESRPADAEDLSARGCEGMCTLS
jgi:hypothetical protein